MLFVVAIIHDDEIKIIISSRVRLRRAERLLKKHHHWQDWLFVFSFSSSGRTCN